jgi:uncharacterized repeat protein (TIGR03803 family)
MLSKKQPMLILEAIIGTLLITANLAEAQTETILCDVCGSQAGVTLDSSGNIYGTSSLNVFELTPQSGGGYAESVIYTFPTLEDTEGTLWLDGAGNLYATNLGAINTGGLVFELSASGSSWTEQTLFTFPKSLKNGDAPYGDLIFDGAGNIYGTTFYGGRYGNQGTGGTAWELSPQAGGGWTQKVLHSFGNGTDGQKPFAGLIFDGAGNLYGTATAGGASGNGTVFELIRQADGTWKQKILHNFGPPIDGAGPRGKLTFDAAGNLYGTTAGGGRYGGGIAYELMPQSNGSWTEKILHHFGNGTDGNGSYSNAVFDAAGNLYGTTFFGGRNGGGVLFKLTPQAGSSWTETIVHNFGAGSDGSGLLGDIVFDAAGNLYGTTQSGGQNSGGTVWEVTP